MEKKLFCRFVTSRSFASLLSILAFAALTLFVFDEAFASPPVLGSGGSTNTLKAIATNTDLFCNLSDPRSTLVINEIENPPSFTMGTPLGKVIICREKVHGTNPAWGSTDANWVSPEIGFTLTQMAITNTGGPSGLIVSSDNGNLTPRTVTWEFIVDNSNKTTEVLEWHLAPADQTNPICLDPSTGQLLNPCVNRMGVPASPKVSDFPDRDVTGDGIPDFGGVNGVVFLYKETVTANGTRLPQTLLLGPCHNGSFNINDPIVCQKGNLQIRTQGDIPGIVPVQVNIQPNSFNVGSAGSLQIRILGEANLNPPPVNTLEVNGTQIFNFSTSFADTNGDGFTDFVAKEDRIEFANTLGCPSPLGTSFTVHITGTFNDPNATKFKGEDLIVTCF